MASNIYLKITTKEGKTYDGNCKAKGHEKKIEILSWGTSVQQEQIGSKQKEKDGKPRSSPSPMTFDKFYDLASDDLMKACWTGQELKTCEFEVFRSVYKKEIKNVAPKDSWFLKIILKNAYISSYNISADGDEIPKEDIEITYEGIEFKYKAVIHKTGELGTAIPMKFDWETNKAE
jgi:type VI secretion system secreted protein Hcp